MIAEISHQKQASSLCLKSDIPTGTAIALQLGSTFTEERQETDSSLCQKTTSLTKASKSECPNYGKHFGMLSFRLRLEDDFYPLKHSHFNTHLK